MGEHLPCKQGVASSNLAISITVNMNLPKSTLKTKHGRNKESKKIKNTSSNRNKERNKCSIATTFHITKLKGGSYKVKQVRAQGECLGTGSR